MFGKTTLKFDDVVQNLLSHATMKKSKESTQDEQGLVAKVVQRGRMNKRGSKTEKPSRSKSRSKKDVECYHCHKKGHIKNQCKKFKEEKRKKAVNSDSASVASDSDGKLLACSSYKDVSDSWILDSGCSYHMCPHREWFDTYKSWNGGEILMGNDAVCKSIGMGTIKIKMWDGVVRTLNEVRHVPALKKNLISLGVLDSNGYVYHSERGALKVSKGSMVVMRGTKLQNNLYKLKGNTVTGGATISTGAEVDELVLWHMRLGHMSEKGMMELHKRKLLKGVQECKLDFCKYCVMGKQTKVSFKVASKGRKNGILDYIHSDVWGPSRIKSKGGARCFVSFIDDFSRKIWVYFMKEKSEVFIKFKEWKAEVENQTGRKIKYLRTDNGGEYNESKFLQFCKDEGIIRHFTVKKTPQQNGVAERFNRTLLERARSMRLHAWLPKSFWAEAVNHACFVINRSPSRALDSKSAEEVWTGRDVDYSLLKVFGCPAYAHIASDERSKLDSKSLPCIFIGFEKGVKGFKLWDPVN